MTYRKLKADYLFDGFELRLSDAVLVCKTDGTVEEIIPEDQASGDIETFSGLLSPGFINCHCHLELSHLKNKIPANQGLVNFLKSVIRLRNDLQDTVQSAMESAETQMLNSGIVAVGDICNSSHSLAIKSLNNLYYYNFIELLGWSPEQAVSRFRNGKELASLFLERLRDEAHLSLNPHAPYSISSELWKLMIPEFPGKTITIHNQESREENEFFKTGKGSLVDFYTSLNINNSHFKSAGTNSLPFYLHYLKSASRILLVHNTYMDEKDIFLAASFHKGLFFCLCPNANLYIENRMPDISTLLKENCRLVLGTDSLASNSQLNILAEMKSIKKEFPKIPSVSLLTWATSNGARALSLDEKLGDFTKNKKPGVVLIEHVSEGEINMESKSRRIL
jgi:cytosine/adenosine deaminase-related metal-dependent hydrolase